MPRMLHAVTSAPVTFDEELWDEEAAAPVPTYIPGIAYASQNSQVESHQIGSRYQQDGRGRNRDFRGRGGRSEASNWREPDGRHSSYDGFARGGFGRRGGRFASSSGEDGQRAPRRSVGREQGGQFNGGNWQRRSDNRNVSQEEEISFAIASKDVGKVIGRGGAKIRELEEQSGARIKLKQDEYDDGDEATVTLRGTTEQSNKAKELIESFLYPARATYTPSEPRQEKQAINWGQLIAQSTEERQHRWEKLPPVKKNFYIEDHDVACMYPEQVSAFRRQNNNIVVSSLNEDDTRAIPNPVSTFEQAFRHYPEILDEIDKQGFERPSPIQSQAWPIVLQGYDMIGIAQTGTGKTLAFILPAMIHIDSQPTPREERPGPSCLVLAPTRELAQQIEREAKKYRYRDIKCVCIYGGGSRREQINVVTRGVEIVIATPGRLNDLVMNRFIDVTSVTFLVLDEADRMLDMGFEPQIKKILLDIRPERQTVMTSATWPEGVRRLANQYMNNPMQVFIGTLDLAAVHSVTQRIEIIADEEKRPFLYDFIYNMQPEDKVMIFVDKKVLADDLSSDFALNGILCQSIHGDREQCDREQALEEFSEGVVRILVATDVASRGIDIKDVTHIFNYDFPRNVEEYVHRVGRTGRAGRKGESITLVTRGDWKQAKELIAILEEASQEVPDELRGMAERYEAWKQRHDEEIAACKRDGRSSGRGPGRQQRRGWRDF